MPITKHPKQTDPLWKGWDHKAQKKGVHHTVYSVNKDQYTGDWDNNKKNGKGTQIWKKSGQVYDGDWKDDLRCGYGMLSKLAEDGSHKKLYAGGWKEDKKDGHGTYYYDENTYYEGEWACGQRSGWGRMFYVDGSVYEGEWSVDMRNGSGMLRLANENRYEGAWLDDLKHGDGKFYYLDKGQMMVGTWMRDIAKCGEMTDFNREAATNPTKYQLPQLKMEDPRDVLEKARVDLNLELEN